MNHQISLLLCTLLLGAATIGCGFQGEQIPERRPRPVIVEALEKQYPPYATVVTASVGSWKTEEIGFEVSGRVEFVAEPNTEIEGRVYDKQGNLILEGTPIGRLESERYGLQVAKAKADVTRAEQTLLAAQTELDENIPAQITAATATRNLAKIEYDRSKRLFAQNARSQGDLDRDKANFDSAEAQLKQLEARKKAQAADIESLKNAKLQAQQDLRNAERNLEDCTLYSSFRGQIADISVVPGSVVDAGQPVATLQMMDPIKVEVEVSAEVSRELRDREVLSVGVSMPDGTVEILDGYRYLIDPVADPRTRTFTVTLLVINRKLEDPAAETTTATTRDIWRLDYKFLPGAKDNMLFIEEKGLHEDSEGHYVWMVTNQTIQTLRASNDDLLKVRKLRVTPGALKIPYLGNWIFQHIVIDDDGFDPKVNLVCGELKVKDGDANDWNGDTLERSSGEQWMLRPGDLVRVDLTNGDNTEGYYVPMSAISRKRGQSYIFVVEESDGKSKAKRVAVRFVGDGRQSATSSLRRIAAVESGSLDGVRYVVEGAHYLIDGEVVNATVRTEAAE